VIPKSLKSFWSILFQCSTNSCGLFPSFSASIRIGVPKSSLAPTCITSCPLSRRYLTNMSAGRYVEVTCPKWISPLAYMSAVVTMILSSAVHLQYYLYMSAVLILKRSGVTIYANCSVSSSFHALITKSLKACQELACVFQKKKDRIT